VSAAAREANEEAGIDPELLDFKIVFTDNHGNWQYHTVIAHTDGNIGEFEANAESEDLQWVPIDNVGGFNLHPGLRATWPQLIDHVKTSLA
jgi:8-oxo-dGTP pyrophosphatase MutT (NUDIX family)